MKQQQRTMFTLLRFNTRANRLIFHSRLLWYICVHENDTWLALIVDVTGLSGRREAAEQRHCLNGVLDVCDCSSDIVSSVLYESDGDSTPVFV